MRKNKIRRLMLAVVMVLVFAVSVAVVGADSPPADLHLELVVSGLEDPVAVVGAGDGTGRLFVVEQAGRILIVLDGTVMVEPFLDLSSQVENSGNEQGLLGLAFHPDFAVNGLFYLNYTHDPAGGGPDVTRVSGFRVSQDNSNHADPGSETVILEFDQDFGNHNGGGLQFGPDGYLYVATGDGGGARDPNARSQDLSSLLGKLLRIDVDGPQPYSVPPDNPFVGVAGAMPEIWAYGLRNPWRFSFDRITGDLFVGDVGQNAREEIDFQSALSGGGQNYGWSCREGDTEANFNSCDGSPLTEPILVYDHALGCSVTGGYRYRGAISGFRGLYVFGDYCSGRIWMASENDGVWSSQEWADTDINISSFGEDDDGELYVVDLGGDIYRFVAPEQAVFRRTSGRRVTPSDSDSGTR